MVKNESNHQAPFAWHVNSDVYSIYSLMQLNYIYVNPQIIYVYKIYYDLTTHICLMKANLYSVEHSARFYFFSFRFATIVRFEKKM